MHNSLEEKPKILGINFSGGSLYCFLINLSRMKQKFRNTADLNRRVARVATYPLFAER